MSKFCNTCDNLLVPYFHNDELIFKCVLCHLNYPANVDDTLRKERIKESNVMIFEKILNKAVDDPTTIKASIDCIKAKCKGKIVKQVRIGEDMQLYNICTTCRIQWIN